MVTLSSSINSTEERVLRYLPVSLPCYDLDDISLLDLHIAATPLLLEKKQKTKVVNFPACGHVLMYVDLSGVNPMSFNAYILVIYVAADLIQN